MASRSQKVSFFFTNLCLTPEQLSVFRLLMDAKTKARDGCICHISDSWKFKFMVSSQPFQGFEPPENVKWWSRSIFINFTTQELEPHFEHVRWMAANFLDERNIGLLQDNVSRELLIRDPTSFDVSDITYVCSYYLGRYKNGQTFIESAPSHNDLVDGQVTMAFQDEPDIDLASLKLALQQLQKIGGRILYLIDPDNLLKLLMRIQGEAIYIARAFPDAAEGIFVDISRRVIGSFANCRLEKFLLETRGWTGNVFAPEFNAEKALVTDFALGAAVNVYQDRLHSVSHPFLIL